jgi:predicted transcriptional regulator
MTEADDTPLALADAAAFEAAVGAGMASLSAGRSVPYEEVRRWLLSWGNDEESPPL